MDANTIVTIHGAKWKLADVQNMVDHCRKRQWRQQQWRRRDALVQRAGMRIPYFGQPYNPNEFEMVPGGWRRNLCEICTWELCESDDEQHSIGYTDGRLWICSECHDQFIHKPL